ncbi:hypothetical protein B0H14DRAFT_2566556 [Mycena olivaceomarginata]|nr:hypothetical protein B0H14DRAFT_2566556 [Mycena olivaceomarginata]
MSGQAQRVVSLRGPKSGHTQQTTAISKCLASLKPLFRSSPPISLSTRHPGPLAEGLSMMIVAAYYASPQRLTHGLVDAMANVKKNYLEAVENGALCASDAHTAATFSSLQLEVSTIRKASLHSSLSHYAMLCDFLKGRTFTVLRCLHKVRELETHIEILKESRLVTSS